MKPPFLPRAARVLRNAAICARAAQGGTLKQIGIEFGLAPQAISRAIADEGQIPKNDLRWPKSRLLGKTVRNRVIIAVLDEIDKYYRRYMILKCKRCGLEVKLSAATVSGQLSRGQGGCKCVLAKFEKVCRKPLKLTIDQARSAMLSAAKGASSVHTQDVEDVIQDSLLNLLLRGKNGVTDLDNIGALAYRIAQFESKRTLGRNDYYAPRSSRARRSGPRSGPVMISEVSDAEGVCRSVFETMTVAIQPTEFRERRAQALADLPAADKVWLLNARGNARGNAAGKEKFSILAAQVRANFEKLGETVVAEPSMTV